VAAAVVALGLAGLTACDSASGSDEPKLAADAAIPDKVPNGTVLRVGDPATQTAIEASGLDEELKDEGVEVEWANISGGPKTLDAFRAHAIDVGSAQDIPPLFAQWTGTDITIVATTSRVDAINYPVYQLGVAPGVDVKSLEDLKGK
jgi:sulfonate transport system substrate-binding protein